MCDADRIDRIIGEIRAHQIELADELARLSTKFAYNEIIKLVAEVREK